MENQRNRTWTRFLPDPADTAAQKTLKEYKLKKEIGRAERIEKELTSAYSKIYDRLSMESKDKLRTETTWSDVSKSRDPIALWKLIKNTHVANESDKLAQQMEENIKLKNLKQNPGESISSYCSRFSEQLENMQRINALRSTADDGETFVANFHTEKHREIVKKIWEELRREKKQTMDYVFAREIAIREEKHEASLDRLVKDQKLMKEEPSFKTKQDDTQKLVAMNTHVSTGVNPRPQNNNNFDNRKRKRFNRYKNGNPRKFQKTNNKEDRSSKQDKNRERSNKQKNDKPYVKKFCVHCQRMKKEKHVIESHNASECRNNPNAQPDYHGLCFTTINATSEGVGLGPTDVILDNGAARTVFNKYAQVEGIKKQRTKLSTIAGGVNFDHVAYHRLWKDGVYEDNAKLTCLSHSNLIAHGMNITWEPQQKAFIVKNPEDGQSYIFRARAGVYVLDKSNNSYNEYAQYSLINPLSRVSQRKSDKVFKLHEALHHVSKERMLAGIRGGYYADWQLTEQDIMDEDLSKCRGCLGGKITSYHAHIPSQRKVSIGEHQHVDILFIKSGAERATPLLISVDEATSFGMGFQFLDKTTERLIEGMKVIAGFYASYGKKVVAFHSDRESNFSATTFEMLKQGIRLIQTAAGVHERTAERYIKGIRDGVKATLEQIRKEYELPVMFYPLLVESIIASYNLAPNYKTGNEVPFGMLSGMKVD